MTQPEQPAPRRGRPPGIPNPPKAAQAPTPPPPVPTEAPAPAPIVEEARAAQPSIITEPSCKANHHIHFLRDGASIAGRVYYRGEEADFKPDTDEWALIHANGICRIDVSKKEQIRRFKHVIFEPGPWPFEAYDPDATDELGDGLTESEKQQLATVNARRGL